jgi:hypothetical protein
LPEHTPSDRWQATHNVEPDLYLADIYRLLSYFLASEKFSYLGMKKEEWCLADLGERHQLIEIPHLLISVAASLRIKADDNTWIFDNKESVGELIEDLANPSDKRNLILREACNKIIHAHKVHFDKAINAKTNREYLIPFLYMYGEKSGNNWKATLDVVRFCEVAHRVIF